MLLLLDGRLFNVFRYAAAAFSRTRLGIFAVFVTVVTAVAVISAVAGVAIITAVAIRFLHQFIDPRLFLLGNLVREVERE